jgi:16S rRNA (guanine1207-N2)-methyltransferase
MLQRGVVFDLVIMGVSAVSEHYYTQKPTVRHDKQIVRTVLRGYELSFQTDSGVFSKEGIDYGSKVLIECMDIPKPANVLDVGCGYGPIGLTAAKLAAAGHVTMLDINERAIELAKQNAERNRVLNVTVLQSDGLGAVDGLMFDRIITNPPIRAGKATVHRIFEEAYHSLVKGGQLWIVIQKKQGAPSAMAKLEQLFEDVREITKDKGYRVIAARK